MLTMLTSFVLPLVFFSMIFGAFWWFARSQRGARPTPVLAAGSEPVAHRGGGSAV